MTATSDTREIRAKVRELTDQWMRDGKLVTTCDSWLRSYDPDFSREMGKRGLIGITWPTEVGGAGKPGVARLVVTEELLRVGAPVAGHWIADRQIGPSILRHGSDAAKAKYLPGIASGEMVFCLGMSETEAGSDLASVRTTATRVDGGWSITGRKVWTSQAHHSTHAYVLARTEKAALKHEGLSEFIVDMSDPGVEVRPIYDLAGEHHFNEVTFDQVRVDDDHVLGTIGQGWKQVTSQLSLERGGIERVLSTYPLFAATIELQRERGSFDRTEAALTGEMLARLAALRAMAVHVALDIDAGGSPVVSAAVLKDLGTSYEKEVNEFARTVAEVEADPGADDIAGLLASGIISSPGFTIRGGTSEVLKTLIARGASGLIDEAKRTRGEVAAAADEVLGDAGGEPNEQDEVRELLAELGWLRVAVDEDHGGEGGSLTEAVEILGSLARNSVSAPIAESIASLRVLARAGRTELDSLGLVTAAVSGSVRVEQHGDTVLLDGVVPRVPWGVASDAVLVPAEGPDGPVYVLVPSNTEGLSWQPASNLAGEPRDTLSLSQASLPASAVIGSDTALLTEVSLFRGAATVGAIETALARSIEHVTTREQFERPLIKFQAVGALLAELGSEFALAQVALEDALNAVAENRRDAASRVAVLRVVASRAATLGARIAHQLHAAMGVTREHPLHLSTRRMWSWRDEAGTAKSWASTLAEQLVPQGEEHVWAWITGEDED